MKKGQPFKFGEGFRVNDSWDGSKRRVELNGKVTITLDKGGPTAVCVRCFKEMPQIHISHNGNPVMTGYGSCKCPVS